MEFGPSRPRSCIRKVAYHATEHCIAKVVTKSQRDPWEAMSGVDNRKLQQSLWARLISENVRHGILGQLAVDGAELAFLFFPLAVRILLSPIQANNMTD